METRSSLLIYGALALGGLVVGACGGYLAGLQVSPQNSQLAELSTSKSEEENTSETSPHDRQTSPINPAHRADQSAKYQPISPEALLKEVGDLDFGGSSMASMRKWASLMERVSVSDCGALAAKLSENKGKPGSEIAWNLVMSAYAEKDPQGAWAFAMTQSTNDRNNALGPVISAMANSDPQGANAKINQISDPQIQRQLRQVLAMNLASKNPRAAFELTQSWPKGDKAQYLNNIFFQWAKNDMEGAKSALSGLQGNEASMARHAVITFLAQKNPQDAWAMANSLATPNSPHLDGKLQVIQIWAQTDPNAALQAAMGISESGTRSRAISSAVSTWASKDFPAALNYSLGVQDSTLRSDILRSLSSSADLQNPGQFLSTLMEHMPPGDNFQQSVNSLISNWASKNTAEAAMAVRQLPPGRMFSQAAAGIAGEWARSGEPTQALTWAKTLPAGEGRQAALNALFSDWSTRAPEEAVAALSSLAPQDRKRAVRAAASGWSRQNPEAVLRWAASLQDPDEKKDVQRDAISQWAGTSPESAAKYVAGLTGESQSRSLETVISRWASKDAESAGDWLMQLPTSQGKDSALSTVARKISSEDPETALSWAGNISDTNRRNRELESIAREWVKQDPKTAKTWISNSNLPEEILKRVLGN